MTCMGEALRTIAFKVRTASCGGTACVNSFGDEQLAVDMLADKLLFEVRLVNLLSKSLSYCAKLRLVLLISCFQKHLTKVRTRVTGKGKESDE